MCVVFFGEMTLETKKLILAPGMLVKFQKRVVSQFCPTAVQGMNGFYVSTCVGSLGLACHQMGY